MASITIGTLTDGGDTITLKYYYSYTQTTSDNASNVSVYIQSTCTANDWPYKLESWSITGTGPTGSGGESSTSTGTHTMATKTKKIFHLSNGAQTFSATIKVTLKYWDGSAWASKSFTKYTGSITLTTINVYSSLSFSPVSPNMQSSVTMTITKPSTTKFTATGVKIVAEYDGTTTTVYEGTGASTSWTVPNLASTTPASTTKDIAIKIQSIRNSTYYTAKEYTLTVNVPSTVIPSCAIGTITDNYNFSAKIKGYSRLTIPVNSGTAGTGASIVSYSVEVRNDNSSGAIIYQATNSTTAATTSFTMPNAIETTSTYIKVTITDSRGRTGTATTTVSAVNYQQPQVTIMAVRSDSNQVPDPLGTYCTVQVTWSITQIGSDNDLYDGKVRLRKSTDGVDFPLYATRSFAAGTYSASFTVRPPLATSDQGYFCVDIQDKVSAQVRSSIKIVPKAQVPASLYDDGSNIGLTVGQMATEGGFNCYLPAKFSLDGITLAGPLADYIIENGKSGNWYYEKWASGKVDAVYHGSVSYGSMSASGNLYRSTNNALAIPSGIFASTPQITLITINNSASVVVSAQGLATSTTNVNVQVWRSTNAASSIDMTIRCIYIP